MASMMFDNRSTYEISAKHIADYIQPLSVGMPAFAFTALDELGRSLNLDEDYLSGKHLVLVFLNTDDNSKNAEALRNFAEGRQAFEDANMAIVAIAATNKKDSNFILKRESGFMWPIANDPSGAVFASYGLHKLHGTGLRMVHVTPHRQVKNWYDAPINIDQTLKEITDMANSLSASEDSRWSACHAPVLHIPNVFSEQECAQLIQSFNTEEGYYIRPPRAGEVAGNFKVPVYEHNRQDRVDQLVKDKATLAFIDQRIAQRVYPVIQKAFAYTVTRREEFHLARYVGAREGLHMGHRDVTANSMTHRRFAFSLTLNSNYEGGKLVFNEYSPHGYQPAAGSALIFSSLLLHEVMEITQGTRYCLITNLFNDDSLKR